MATTEEVKKLAALARISVADDELEAFTREFDSILAYVGQLEQFDFSPSMIGGKSALHTVMREDGTPHPAEIYTEKIVAQFPAREGNSLSVKQIISHE